ncbi:MAG: hypothetical protein ACRC06_12440 [Waterburya sp.]
MREIRCVFYLIFWRSLLESKKYICKFYFLVNNILLSISWFVYRAIAWYGGRNLGDS